MVGGGARARARQVMRAEVATIVGDLVLAHGYDATTIEDICSTADISRTTFFRYFASKEDALFGTAVDAGEGLRQALVARPDDERPWLAITYALDPLIDQYDVDDERTRALIRVVVTTPTLAARHREKNDRWYEVLRPEVARRLGVDPGDTSDPRPQALIGAALGCVDAALRTWVSTDSTRTLREMLDLAMEAPSTVGRPS